VNALRLRQQRNFLVTLLLSQGVPMLAHGDEMGRTQLGNNNTYCQDNDLTWVDWDLDEDNAELLRFTRRLVQLRKDHPVFRRRRFFAGNANHGGESDLGDIAWFMPNGKHMDEAAWSDGMARSLMVFLNGNAIPAPDRRGNVVRDDCFIVVFNAHDDAITFTLPEEEYGPEWYIEVDTALSASAATHASALAGDPVTAATSSAAASTVLEPETEFSVAPRSIVVLRSPCGPEE
jgi:glycogen operon protein